MIDAILVKMKGCMKQLYAGEIFNNLMAIGGGYVNCPSENYCILQTGYGPSPPPLKVQKEQSVLNMRSDTILKIFIQFTVPKNSRRNAHETRKPLFS